MALSFHIVVLVMLYMLAIFAVILSIALFEVKHREFKFCLVCLCVALGVAFIYAELVQASHFDVLMISAHIAQLNVAIIDLIIGFRAYTL